MLKSIFKRKITLHELLFTFFLFFYWSLNVNGIYMNGRYTDRIRIPCGDSDIFPNGYSVAKRRNMLLQHFCNYGFTLIGERRNQCNRGKWVGDRPVCARSGCLAPSKNPDNGRIQYIDQYRIGVYCTEGYELAGNRYAYCNGTHWDRPIGYCRERDEGADHECDFETDDACGWVTDTAEGFKWKRTMAANVFTSFRTGPQHDHTTMQASGGHYMLMESYGANLPPIALTSPIYGRDLSLKTACCFQFYYFMYGAGVGNLTVYVKPVTKMLSEIIKNGKNYIKFTKSGNQNNIWNEAHFSIEEMEDDFQIVFVADGAKNHLSDIAIDDVKIMYGSECKALDNHDDDADDSAEYEPTTTEQALYDTSSCVSRCGKEGNSGIMRNSTYLIGLCSCHDSCIADDNCCPDYVKECLDAPDSTTIQPEAVPTVINVQEKRTTLNKLLITTSNTTTTTTAIISATTTTRNTTTTTTTTTPKPTTTTAATTTTTTRKPTTKATTTTTTTTTTRKPITTTTPTTTTTRRTTTTTTKTTTTPKPTRTTTKLTKPTPTTTTRSTTKTTTTTVRSSIPTTTPTTTTTAATKLLLIQTTSIPRTHIILTSTTGATTINRKTFTGDTVEVPKTKKSQTPTNVVKKTWEWQPKPESNPRGSLALLFVFGILLIAIIMAVVIRQKETLKAIWIQKFLKKNGTENGAEDTNSIIANFATEEATSTGNDVTTSTSIVGNRLKLTLPSLKRSKPEKRGSSGEQSLLDETENDDIPLL